MATKVLIVDDNPEERKIFAAYFNFVGGTVIEAANGEEGIRQAREHSPDLILMDLTMPVMDGWEAVRKLQEDPDWRRIPVVAVTAHHLSPDILEAAGFSGYLEKPLAPYRVLEEVERCVGCFPGESAPREADNRASETDSTEIAEPEPPC